MRKTIAIILALLPLPAVAQAPSVGWTLAERWCMACHVIERGRGTATSGDVPSFPAIAIRSNTTPETLDRYISVGHTHMPDFFLSRSERDALVAYILSLR